MAHRGPYTQDLQEKHVSTLRETKAALNEATGAIARLNNELAQKNALIHKLRTEIANYQSK